jgi:hypothetical protein
MMRTVGILWGITIGMVHSVKNGISSWRKVGTALPDPCKDIKKPFPEFCHVEHLVSGIPVKKETLAKQGEIPMEKE